ncbi:MAG TPA: universal stress protein, partial [Burkholderiaceae bacterium]|nr:universal stress protein [Burkholderiaceae bacterium]
GHPLLVTKTQELQEYKEVIVGIDFSTASQRALDTVAQIAPGAHVSALHAVHLDREGGIAHLPVHLQAAEELRQEALKACREELDEFLGDSQDTQAIVRSCEVGHAGRVLLERAKAAHADLIVVGKSDAGPADAFFGSVAKRVMSNSSCDVLVVP